jgi:hypothetical protein
MAIEDGCADLLQDLLRGAWIHFACENDYRLYPEGHRIMKICIRPKEEIRAWHWAMNLHHSRKGNGFYCTFGSTFESSSDPLTASVEFRSSGCDGLDNLATKPDSGDQQRIYSPHVRDNTSKAREMSNVE